MKRIALLPTVMTLVFSVLPAMACEEGDSKCVGGHRYQCSCVGGSNCYWVVESGVQCNAFRKQNLADLLKRISSRTSTGIMK